MLRHNQAAAAAWAAAYKAIGKEPPKVPDSLLMKAASPAGPPMVATMPKAKAVAVPGKAKAAANEATHEESLLAVFAKWSRLRAVMASVFEWRQLCKTAVVDANKDYSEVCSRCQKYNKEYAALDSEIKESQRL